MSALSPAARVVLAVLEGRDGEPITLRDLADFTGPSFRRRDVEMACQELRLAGQPIVSTSDGVRLGTADEALACAAALRKRAITQLVTSRALRVTARRMKEAEDSRTSQTFWDFFESWQSSAVSKSA
jgi:hypothetical protein